MTPSSSLPKRIKRHIVGQRHSFFIATEPHLGQICCSELTSAFPNVSDVKVVTGGVEFTGRVEDCYLANLKLKTANRILLRVSEFKATNFNQLEQKIADIPWELYINPDSGLEVHVSSQKSRLYHKEAVKDRVIRVISKRPPDVLSSTFVQQIYIRGVEDRFTVSIDSSGELLYKRGIKSFGHRAPIRETLAAAALIISGFSPDEPFLDPMCGAGTFSIEVALMAQNIPPGWFRSFAFMHWPAFKHNQWEYFRKIERQSYKEVQEPSVFASDIDEKTCENFNAAVAASGLSKTIQVASKDFFSFHPSEFTDRYGTVAINPPYGLRLQPPEQALLFFRRIIEHLASNYLNWKFILIVPWKHWLKDIPFEHAVLPVFHGGLTVYLTTGKI